MVSKVRPLKIALLFPPGWSLNVGNPHPALPFLKAALIQSGFEVDVADLNIGAADYYGVRISDEDAIGAIGPLTMQSMNEAYFAAEDRLNHVSAQYQGKWDLQLGFRFTELSFYSPSDVRVALELDSPFTKYYKGTVVPQIERGNYDLVGFSIASIYQLIPALHLSWLLRKSGYTGLIIFGGNTVSRLKEEFKCEPWLFDIVDGFIYNQGEKPLVALVECVSSKRDFSQVPHFIWRHESVIHNDSISASQDPNDFQTPSFSGLPIGQYWGINYLPMVSARGCYYGRCNFCAIPFGYGENGYGGMRNSERILQDIVALEQQYGQRKFKFVDEAIPPKILQELPQLLIQNSLQVEWEAYARFEKCWTEMKFLEQLATTGFRKAYFGLEIVPYDSRTGLNKHDAANEYLEIIKRCKDAGIKVHLFCMFGYPGTGREEAVKTLEFILNHSHLIDTIDLNAFTYAKHTTVGGIKELIIPGHDWALEFDYAPMVEGVLSSKEVEEMAAEIEDILWDECPRLLHPTYRLVSPWNLETKELERQIQDAQPALY